MSDRIAVMNQGRYEQLGDPEELYERPTTRFVAGFLGVSNLLRGTRGADDGAHATVRIDGANDVRVVRERLGSEADVELGVRPEKIRLVTPGDEVPAQMNRLTGTVTDASYLGVSTSYIVHLATGVDVTVYEQNVSHTDRGSLHRPGESVTLAWAPEHTFVVHDSGPPAAGETGAP